jgi:hypothetical protein
MKNDDLISMPLVGLIGIRQSCMGFVQCISLIGSAYLEYMEMQKELLPRRYAIVFQRSHRRILCVRSDTDLKRRLCWDFRLFRDH